MPGPYFITIFKLVFLFSFWYFNTPIYISRAKRGSLEGFPLPTPGGLIVQTLMGLLILDFPSLGVEVTNVKCGPIVPDNTSQNCMCMGCCDVNEILVTSMVTGVI